MSKPIRFALIQSGLCVFGTGHTYRDCLRDAAQWLEADEGGAYYTPAMCSRSEKVAAIVPCPVYRHWVPTVIEVAGALRAATLRVRRVPIATAAHRVLRVVIGVVIGGGGVPEARSIKAGAA